MSDWQQVQQLFLDTVDLPPAERTRLLSLVDDLELRTEVESLLSADQDSGHTLDEAVQAEALSLFDSRTLIGERLGIYRIVRELGRGGMGTVYLALRDDQEFQKEVALKIVKRGMDTDDVLERFRYERQILANLEHPYIARLFDGGSTSDGVPFFVMEYVEGVPVDVFCRENHLSITERCRLFIRILEAVAYAHRSLVVHRDLKPANILITADGTPKLLDFGVAKLLNGDANDPDALRTRTAALRPFTAGYASPEQVRGLPITTATDVYALGVIFYELLTGKPAQPIHTHSPSEIERVVCETEPIRPIQQRPGLPAELDSILCMALRKEPERRYRSATQFAEDIENHLTGMPVLAQPDSLRYRATKFFLRNREAVIAISIIILSILIGLVVALWQADRARVAEHLADARANQILDLADRTLFDVHDAIARLPGSVAARQTLVKTTIDYLEDLQRSQGPNQELDDQMRQTLAAAYYKIAMIQGDPQGASLQDFAGAETNLHKGESLLIPAYNRHPDDPTLMRRLIEVRSGLAEILYRSGRRNEGVAAYEKLLPVAHKLAQASNCPLECRTQEPDIENRLTYELLPEPERAIQHATRGIALERTLIAANPSDADLRQSLGSLTAAAAGAYRSLGNLEMAAKFYQDSIAAREELLRANPTDVATRRNLMIAYGNYTALLDIPWSPNLERPAEARIYGEKCVAIARQISAADPNDLTARHDLGMSLSRLGMVDPLPGKSAQSLAELEESRSLIEPFAQANPRSPEIAAQLALILEYQGHRLEGLSRRTEALDHYQRSVTLLQPFLSFDNSPIIGQYLSSEEDIAQLDSASGQSAAALDHANRALAEAERFNTRLPHTQAQPLLLANAWSVLALVQSHTPASAQAQRSARTAMEVWQTIDSPSLLIPYRHTIASTQSLLTF